jgi:hypothetical protein
MSRNCSIHSTSEFQMELKARNFSQRSSMNLKSHLMKQNHMTSSPQ